MIMKTEDILKLLEEWANECGGGFAIAFGQMREDERVSGRMLAYGDEKLQLACLDVLTKGTMGRYRRLLLDKYPSEKGSRYDVGIRP